MYLRLSMLVPKVDLTAVHGNVKEENEAGFPAGLWLELRAYRNVASTRSTAQCLSLQAPRKLSKAPCSW